MNGCNICGCRSLQPLRVRSDGLMVQRCSRCEMGVLARIPEDLSIFYDDDYYEGKVADSHGRGYDDYSFTAEHGVAWAAALVPLLKSCGKVLDIGCVDGYLLNKLDSGFEPFGIEVNEAMRGRAAAQGVHIIGSDLLDPAVIASHTGQFDVVTSIAVFEHLSDFRGGVAAALTMLKDDGVLLFEVPLISETSDNTTWFTSSLEHIFYPSEKALRHLIQTELNGCLIGAEISVRYLCLDLHRDCAEAAR